MLCFREIATDAGEYNCLKRQEENEPTSSQTAAIRAVGIDLYKRIITFTAKWDHRNRTEVKEVFLAEGQDLEVPRGFVSFKW